jgi:hypothetical protein
MRKSIGLGLALFLFPQAAWAGDEVLAETLFREGKELMQAKDYARACPKLAESYRQDPATGTLLALGMCQEQSGLLASAWTTYNAVVARAQREGQKDRETAAKQRVAALEPRLSKLTLEVPAELARLPGFKVLRDGAPVPEAAWGSAVPVDPGRHVVEATADGRARWEQAVTFTADADRKTLRVAVPEEGKPAVIAPAQKAEEPPASENSPAAREDKPGGANPVRTVGWVVGGVGLAAVAVGGYFGLRSNSLHEDAKQDGHCSEADGCDEEGLDLVRQAKDAASVANILFISGGVLVAAGVTMYLVGAPTDTSTASVKLAPSMTSKGPGVTLSGRF